MERVNALAAALVLNEAVGSDLFAAASGLASGAAGAAPSAAAGGEVGGGGGESQGEGEAARDALEADWTFSPEKGNVVFASAYDGW